MRGKSIITLILISALMLASASGCGRALRSSSPVEEPSTPAGPSLFQASISIDGSEPIKMLLERADYYLLLYSVDQLTRRLTLTQRILGQLQFDPQVAAALRGAKWQVKEISVEEAK